jgi:hypothetical protein
MIFIRLVFLLLVLMSSNIFAQTQSQTSEQNNKPQTYKFDEYGKITRKKLEIRLRKFFSEIVESCSRGITESCATGNIVIYAPNERRINQREQELRWFFRLHSVGGFFDRFDITRITLIRPIRAEVDKTEFWIIPKGAEPPQFKLKAYKFDEYQSSTTAQLKRKLRSFLRQMLSTDAKGYIVVYAPTRRKTNLLVDRVAKVIHSSVDFDFSRLKFADVKNAKEKAEFWIVPEGAEPPTFEKVIK